MATEARPQAAAPTDALSPPGAIASSRSKSGTYLRDGAVMGVVLAAVIGSWYLVAALVGTEWVSDPTLVARALVTSASNGQLAQNVLATLEEVVIGLLLGIPAGAVGGVLLGTAPSLIRRGVYPYIIGAYSLPRVALAPFFVLWFGIGLESKVILIVSVVGFVVLFSVQQGLQTIDRDLLDALRSMGATPWQVVRYVVVPSLVSWIVSAAKISVGLAVVSAVVGEMVGATQGLGYWVTASLNQADMTDAVAALLLMAAMALLLYACVALVERYALRWQAHGAGMARQQTVALG
ncbi:MAG: ABC transporter permease [Chloroflexota bacterium]|nr:ABC transporter permease [Chloroflexota bacterium]MDE3101672.1 ABC transporter permease [Chloroflexota bacterium]